MKKFHFLIFLGYFVSLAVHAHSICNLWPKPKVYEMKGPNFSAPVVYLVKPNVYSPSSLSYLYDFLESLPVVVKEHSRNRIVIQFVNKLEEVSIHQLEAYKLSVSRNQIVITLTDSKRVILGC